MPGPATPREELGRQMERMDRMKAVDEHINMYCNDLGEMKESQVLTEKEELNRKEIIEDG